MKNVLLVTQGFPYGTSEQGFLPTEYQKLQDAFHLCVCAYGDAGEPSVALSPAVVHRTYSWPGGKSLLGLLRQYKRPEVRADIALMLKSGKPKPLAAMAWILLYSYRAEQVTEYFREIISREHIDMVYTYWCVQATVAAVRLKAEFPGLRVVTRFHGMDLYEEQLAQDWQPLRPFLGKNCDRLIFICDAGREYFFSHWGRDWAEKTSVIHVGCRALPRRETAYPPDQPLRLVSCSSVIPIKRVKLIAESLAALPPQVRAEWHHFGGGELMEELRDRASALLANRPSIRYTLHGPIPNAVLPQAYLDADAQLFITVSQTEGLPVSMMEAFAMGIPVIATAVGGIPEMIRDGVNGFLLPPNPKPVDVADALMRYHALAEEEKRAMSQAAYDSWRTAYDAEQNADKLIDLLNQTMEATEAR